MEATEVVGTDLDIDNLPERLFVFHESASTLQHIASHTVALQIWHHYLNRAKSGKTRETKNKNFFATVFELDECYESESKKLVELLKTPGNIEEMLKRSLASIHWGTNRWINHFEYKIFTGRLLRYRPCNFDANHIVWQQNCRIDYKKSVSKMLTEGKLCVVQKFILMCTYGMTEELERFPISSLPEFFCLSGISVLMVAYWISYHRPDLREIWLRIPDMVRLENTSINVTMAAECAGRSLPYAFEYFWNRLNEDEQMSFAVRLSSSSFECLRIMLSSMPCFQQRELVDRIPIKLMTDFCYRFDMPEYAFVIWTRIKHTITEQQFCEFLKTAFEHAMHFEKSMVIFTNVWNTASDHLKRHITEINPNIIFTPFMSYWQVPPPDVRRFFMTFLPLVNEDTRKQLIFSLDVDFVLVRRPDIEILNLCLPKETDRSQFKNRMLESPHVVDYCAEIVSVALLNDTKYDEVIIMVEVFSQNARVARKFFKKLLVSEQLYPRTFILHYENWNKLSNFIDTVFTNFLSAASKLKKRLVSSFSARAVHHWDKNENVDELVKITEQVFSTEEMKTFKQTLLIHFQKTISSRISWRDLKGKCFNTFVSWCLDEERRIIDFKSIVQIDAFFDHIFRTICSAAGHQPLTLLYDDLDEFLKYFCASTEEVELVKIRKYYECDRYWIRKVEQNVDGENQRTIFDWFFNKRYYL